MSTNRAISTTAIAEVVHNPIKRGYLSIVDLSADQDGTITAGTVTIECRSPNGAAFSTPTVSVIDMAAPERIEIQGKLEAYRFTVAGFAGTATEIKLEFDGYASGTS